MPDKKETALFHQTVANLQGDHKTPTSPSKSEGHKPESQRLIWLSVMRGLTILLVVMFHVQLIDRSTGENHAIIHTINSYFDAFRMPLFIFSSGGLLYLSRIKKNWQTPKVYWDKCGRILTPLFFFVTVYYLIKILGSQLVKTPPSLSFSDFLLSFVFYTGRPSAPLWFLATLMSLMLLYPLFQRLTKSQWGMHGFLLLTIALYFLDLSAYERYNYFNLLHIHHYLIYFFLGIYFFHFRLYQLLDNRVVLAVLLILYAIFHSIELPLVSSLLGITMMVSLSQQLARCFPALCKHWREYIFQVYLMGMICQAIVELVLWQRLFYNESLFILFYLLNIAAGLYIPVLIAKQVERCHLKFVRLCFGLK